MDPRLVYILAAGVGMGVFLALSGLVMLIQRSQAGVERLVTYTMSAEPIISDEQPKNPLARLDAWLAKRSFGAGIARKLTQADIKLTVTEYVLMHIGLAAVGLVAGPLLLKSPIGGVLGAALGLVIPQIYVSMSQSKRLKAFDEQLPSALDSMANALRGGYGLVQAMTVVATEMAPPLAGEFKRVVTEIGYGLSYRAAFQNMLRRNPGSDLSLVISAIEIHLEMGGNLAEILEGISTIIRDRVRIKAQVSAYTVQQRLSASVLVGMPFGLGGIIFMANPGYISLLWQTTGGLLMLGLAGGMVAAGAFMLKKISTIDI